MNKLEQENVINLLTIALESTKALHNAYLKTVSGVKPGTALAEQMRQQMDNQVFSIVEGLYLTTKAITGNAKHG